MKRTTVLKKRRELVKYAAKLNTLLKSKNQESRFHITHLYNKIKNLVDELNRFMSNSELRRTLGVAALLFGVTAFNKAEAQKFLPPVENPYGLDSTRGFTIPTFVDLDDDGDYDMLAGEFDGNWKYFENIGTAQSPKFSNPSSNPFNLDTTTYIGAPVFADIDDDGDFDLFAGEYYGRIKYFENVGSKTVPSFAKPINQPFGIDTTYNYSFPTFADLDGDGDSDLLIGTYGGNMEYSENIGSSSSPIFSSPVNVPFGLDSTSELAIPHFTDLDSDGDYDLMVSGYSGELTYFENTGTATKPSFTSSKDPFNMVDTSGSDITYIFPTTIDLDDDGDLDVLFGVAGNTLLYFEQDKPTAIGQEGFNLLEVYPNPSRGVVNIQSEYELIQVQVLDVLGKEVLMENGNVQYLALGHLKPGSYLIKMTRKDGKTATRSIIRE